MKRSALLVAALAQGTSLLVMRVDAHPWGWSTRLAPPAVGIVALYIGVMLAITALFARELAVDQRDPRTQRAAAFSVAFGVGTLGMIDFVPAFLADGRRDGGGRLPWMGVAPVSSVVAGGS